MSVSEAWARSLPVRIVLILMTAAMGLTTSLTTAAVIGIWSMAGDVRENSALIRVFQTSVEVHDDRLRVLERHRGWPPGDQ